MTTAVLLLIAAVVLVGTGVMVWALCEPPRDRRPQEWRALAQDAESLAALARERARQELADRVRRRSERA